MDFDKEDIMASAQASTSKDDLIVAAIGHTTFCAKAKVHPKPKANGSHSSDMSKVDYEAVDYDSPEEIMTDKEIEIVEMKCLKEMGLYCENYMYNYMYNFIHNSRPASEALEPAVHYDNK